MKIGFYQSYWGQIGGGQRYTGLAAQFLSEVAGVEFVHHCADFDRQRIEEALELDLSRVEFRYLPPLPRPERQSANPAARLAEARRWGREFSEPYDLFINNSDHIPVFSHAKCGVLLTHFPLVTYEEFNGRTNVAWASRPLVSRCARKVFQRYEWKQRFGSYRKFIVNSGYGQHWIRRRWGVSADVLYPPLRCGLAAEAKEPLILTVGAFHDLQHKKQDVLLEAFKELVDGGLTGWRYVLAGGSNNSPAAVSFIERLRKSAAGYPVEIRTNMPGDELAGLFRRAAILWHAMGYGVDAVKQPDKFEHFGMVATEAMSAGCVPAVFDGGGLPEIVNHGRNGILWKTLNELQSSTRRLIADNSTLRSMASEAAERSKEFSTNVFRERLFDILGPFLNGARHNKAAVGLHA